MSTKRIVTVGLELASGDTQYASFRSKLSLLDWDIVLFKPEISDFLSYVTDYYQGKPSLDESTSFSLKECCEHWRRELKQAVETGKTVIVYLSSLREVFVDTGQRSYSGTGRNRQATRHVSLYTNYQSIPASLTPVVATGSSMKLVDKGAEVLASYWSEFESRSHYQVLLTAEKVPASLVTRTGAKAVGALYRSKASAGTLVLLPDIDFYDATFVKEKGAKQTWTPAAGQFAGQFVSAIVSLDKALRSSSEVTPEPSWAAAPGYTLGPEAELRVQLLAAEQRVEEAQRQKEDTADRLSAAGRHRALLYEKGKPLENAIVEALRLLGFTAAPYKESDSEFDVVFESAEGRLIGEAEGKDSKAINVDKLRQLSMNIHEDLQREAVSTPAKPVLFGNGFRLQPIAERPDPFSEKCHSAAATSSTALVHTPDLFTVVQSLLAQPNPVYARECRIAITQTTGRVRFPPMLERTLPTSETTSGESQSDA
ncbi:MAG TPA: hypothetical protein VGE55_11060 [Limnobacter sp.]|uniref:hypothetical protein n=1 Tax=Limnobacter sp. TaxID=2003368 RepID=UPI002ED9FCED